MPSPSEDTIALALLVMVVVGQLVAARWVSAVPKIFRRAEWLLMRRLEKMKKELDALNSVDSFAAFSKAQREVAKVEKQLTAAKTSYGQRPALQRYAPYLVSVVAQFGFVLPAWKLFHQKELVMVPNFLAFGFFRSVGYGDVSVWEATGRFVSLCGSGIGWSSVSSPHASSGNEWIRSVGVVPWCAVCLISWLHVRRCLFG